MVAYLNQADKVPDYGYISACYFSKSWMCMEGNQGYCNIVTTNINGRCICILCMLVLLQIRNQLHHIINGFPSNVYVSMLDDINLICTILSQNTKAHIEEIRSDAESLKKMKQQQKQQQSKVHMYV